MTSTSTGPSHAIPGSSARRGGRGRRGGRCGRIGTRGRRARHDAVVEHRDDGTVVVRLAVTDPDALLPWVLDLLDHAEVLAPDASGGDDRAARGHRRPGGRGPRGDAGDTATRLRRLLAILAWLAQVGEAPIDEVAERFDLTPEALVAELEMAACCGVPPYTPDQLIEIVVTDTTVSTRLGTPLPAPAGSARRRDSPWPRPPAPYWPCPGSDDGGALSRALAKLDRALGGEEVAVELDTPALLPLVREAVGSGRRLAVSYYSASTDKVTDREIRRTGCSARRATGTSTPGASRPPACGGSGSTGSAPPSWRDPSRRRRPLPTAAAITGRYLRSGARSEAGGQGFEPFVPGPDAGGCGCRSTRPRPGWSTRSPPPGRRRRPADRWRSRSSWAVTPGSNACSFASAPTPGWSIRRSTRIWRADAANRSPPALPGPVAGRRRFAGGARGRSGMLLALWPTYGRHSPSTVPDKVALWSRDGLAKSRYRLVKMLPATGSGRRSGSGRETSRRRCSATRGRSNCT